MGAVAILAAVPILVLGVSLALASRMSGDARRVDVAGSLRMSGFIVAAQLNSYIANPVAYKRDIVEDEIAAMHEALVALEYGSSVLRVERVREAALRERVAEARHALDLYRNVTNHTFERVEHGLVEPEEREAVSQEILGSGYGMLAVTQRLVREIEGRASARLRHLWVFQISAVLVALGISLVTLWAVQRFVLGPIPRLLAALSDVETGRYGVQLKVPGETEFSGLARGFNTMSQALERTHHELVAKQAEILEKNAELERASKLKSQFVANMSHELRTPLNAVIGYTKLLRRGVFGDLPERVREPLQGIDETSTALLGLINDILDVAKVEAGKMDLQIESFRIEDIVEQVGEMLQPLAIGKGLDLVVRLENDVPTVTTDRDKIRRILLNLVGNGIKFTRRGRVEIELLPAQAGWFEIAVHDTGIGIAAADFDAIFDDFHQLDGSSAREHGGTGLGLAISRRLARHLGGDIRVESTPGRGSTFTLRLPLFVHVDGGVVAAGPGPAPTGPASRGETS